MADSAKSTAHSMVDKAENATQSAHESAQQNKDQNPGFLQQVIYLWEIYILAANLVYHKFSPVIGHLVDQSVGWRFRSRKLK